jgi:hypothetical protein
MPIATCFYILTNSPQTSANTETGNWVLENSIPSAAPPTQAQCVQALNYLIDFNPTTICVNVVRSTLQRRNLSHSVCVGEGC